MDLAGKTALITGTRRIGAVVAASLASAGADVAIVYNKSKTEADEAAANARNHGRRAFVLQADLSEPAQCATLVDRAVKELGRLDVLVNMASIYVSIPFDQLTVAQYDENMNVDLRSAFICSRSATGVARPSSVKSKVGCPQGCGLEWIKIRYFTTSS